MPAKKKKTGKWFPRGSAVVVFRSGNVFTGVKIHDKEFRVKTSDLGMVRVPTRRIKSIVYKNLPLYPEDELKTLGATILAGVVTNDPVTMESKDTGEVKKIPRSKILSIIW